MADMDAASETALYLKENPLPYITMYTPGSGEIFVGGL
jgi:hypothetical protein